MALRAYREAYAVYEVAINNPNVSKAEALSKKPSQRSIARRHGIDHTTLGRRLHGQISKKELALAIQRLKPEEEQVIERQIIQLHRWNFPPRPNKVRFMANMLLRARGDHQPVGYY